MKGTRLDSTHKFQPSDEVKPCSVPMSTQILKKARFLCQIEFCYLDEVIDKPIAPMCVAAISTPSSLLSTVNALVFMYLIIAQTNILNGLYKHTNGAHRGSDGRVTYTDCL